MFIWWITRPTDEFKGFILVRRQRVFVERTAYDQIAGIYDSLDDARADIPLGLMRFRKHDDDDAEVVESYL